MTISNEFNTLQDTKSAIKQAIINKGVAIGDNDSFQSYASKINSIPQSGTTPTLVTKTITANGTYSASSDNADGFSRVDVNVPSTAPTLASLTVTPSTTAQTLTVPSGTDGYNTVKVSAVTSAIDPDITAGNIKSGVEILGVTGSYNGTTPSGTKTITANGTYDVAEYASANVNVPASSSGGFDTTGMVHFQNTDGTAEEIGAPTDIYMYDPETTANIYDSNGNAIEVRNVIHGHYAVEEAFVAAVQEEFAQGTLNMDDIFVYISEKITASKKGQVDWYELQLSIGTEIVVNYVGYVT